MYFQSFVRCTFFYLYLFTYLMFLSAFCCFVIIVILFSVFSLFFCWLIATKNIFFFHSRKLFLYFFSWIDEKNCRFFFCCCSVWFVFGSVRPRIFACNFCFLKKWQAQEIHAKHHNVILPLKMLPKHTLFLWRQMLTKRACWSRKRRHTYTDQTQIKKTALFPIFYST